MGFLTASSDNQPQPVDKISGPIQNYIPLDKNLMKKEGENIKFEKAIENTKLIAFYFSKHDCAPCLAFTPILSELYSEIN